MHNIQRVINYPLLIIFILFTCSNAFAQSLVNPIIGNLGYESRHQVAVSDTSSEFELVQAHLAYTENLLRQQQVEHLSEKQKQNRAKVLDLLHVYWKNGQFPVNTAYSNERRPCFVDENKTICAVGYLMEETVGKDLVQQINEQYQYAFIKDMHSEAFVQWIQEYGFNKTEVATIQPAYGFRIPGNLTPDHEKGIQEIISYNENNDGKWIEINYTVQKGGTVNNVHIRHGKGILKRKEQKKLLHFVKDFHFKVSKAWYPLPYKRSVVILFDDPNISEKIASYSFEAADTTLQEIQIEGEILDKNSNDPLIGAMVLLVDSEPIISAVANIEGKFLLSIPKDQVRQGDFDLKIIYPFYEKLIIKKIPYNHQKIKIIINKSYARIDQIEAKRQMVTISPKKKLEKA